MKPAFRVLAAAAAALAIAALVVAAVPASAQNAGVSFTATPAVSQLLAHYAVTPQARAAQNGAGGANSNATAVQDELIDSAADVPEAPAGVTISRSVSGDTTSDSQAGSGVEGSQGAGNNVTPAAGTTFIGQQGSAKTCSYFAQGCNPPDMGLAASPRFVLQGVNTQFEIWDTAGNVQPGWPVGAQAFFGVPNVTKADGTPCDTSHLSQPFLSDPRAIYDTTTGRFWAAILQVEGGFGVAGDCPFKSAYYIAVSQTSDPRGSWNVYEFEMSLGQTVPVLTTTGTVIEPVGADYTMIGLDHQALYFSANMFTQDGNHFEWAEIFEANKAEMEAGQASFTADGFFKLRAIGPGATYRASTVQPTNNLDRSAGGVENFVDTFSAPDPVTGNLCGRTGKNDPCSGLAVWALANATAHDSGGPAPTLSGTYVATQPYLIVPSADEPSCNRCVAANDLRIPGTPVVRDGVLYTGWGTAIHSVSKTVPGIQWAEINLSDGSASNGYYTQPDTAVTYPALMPNPDGQTVMLFERMSSSLMPETDYVVKDEGQNNFGTDFVVLKTGESSYRPGLCGTKALPVCRWGDYEAVSFDGQNRIWLAGQYANTFQGATVAPAFGRNWGTWLGAIG